MNEFLQRLKQRKLVQWSVAYVAAAFALLQGIDIVAQRFGWPDWIERALIIASCMGFFVVIVLAWYHGERGAQRVTGTELLILALLLSLGGFFLWRFAGTSHDRVVAAATGPAPAATSVASTPAPIPEKSVAVLPFENLSDEKQNAYFADGVQDEILTDLAKVAGLKVISRSSVMQYKSGIARNLREIGQQLGVAHLLEGSVQRAANKVRVNAQLIDARSNSPEWAENYDRPLDDVFAIQSEIAKAIADQLQAKIAPPQLAEIDRKPTANLAAYDAFLRGLALARQGYDYVPSETSRMIKCFREAVRLDPAFTEAWAWLARELSFAFFNELERNPATLASAREAAGKANELQPGSAEANLAQGYVAYYGELDFGGAVGWFEKARKLAPNDSEIYRALALISRREGRWRESAAYFQQAAELNPRDPSLLKEQTATLSPLRDYFSVLKIDNTLLEINPDDKDSLASKISIYHAIGDLKTAATLLPHPIDNSDWLLLLQINQWTYERRYEEAIAALRAALPKTNTPELSYLREGYLETLAFLYHYAGKPRETEATARELQALLKANYKGEMLPYSLSSLAEAYALEGDKDRAIATVQPAQKEKDAVTAVEFSLTMAQIGALTSDKEMALTHLAIAAQTPTGLNYGDLKFSPLWDALRGDPRFEKIVALLAPKAFPQPVK